VNGKGGAKARKTGNQKIAEEKAKKAKKAKKTKTRKE
jgi:hypothetical protein